MQIQGVKVVDGKRPITLVIKPQDISKGKRKDVGSCAAAQACARQLQAVETIIQKGRIYVKRKSNPKQWERYRMPTALAMEMVAFDRGGDFMPGEYDIKPLPKSQALGQQRGSDQQKRKRSPTRRRSARQHVTTNIRQSVVSRASGLKK